MKKLVLRYFYRYSEECGCGGGDYPFEYESKEKAEYDLLALWENQNLNKKKFEEYSKSNPYDYIKDYSNYRDYKLKNPYTCQGIIEFAGFRIDLNDLDYSNGGDTPEILELEEWFEKYKNGQ